MDFSEVVATVKAVHGQTRRIETNNEHRGRSLTVFLRGDPGLGKSEAIYAAGKALGVNVRTLIAAQFDPADLGGFPFRDTVTDADGKPKHTMKRARPFFLPEDGEGILFCDELSQCPVSIQNIFAQLVQERRIGEHVLGPKWTIVLAGNKQSNRAGTTVLVRQLTNRCQFIDMAVNPDQWLNWAAGAEVDPMIMGYIAFNKLKSLHQFDAAVEVNPTPRSWEKASEVRKLRLEDHVEFELLKGTVGDSEGAGLRGFIRNHEKVPDPEKIIAAPTTTELPRGPELTYATAAALIGHTTAKTIGPILKYMDRIERKEFVVFYLKSIKGRDAAMFASAKPVADWLYKNAGLLV